MQRYLDLISKFKNKKILVIGDLVLDEYWYGTIQRVSREAPVLILDYDNTRPSLGGAANAIDNLISFDSQVFAVSAIGNDSSSKTLFDIFKTRDKNINFEGIILENYLHTPTKIRVMAGCMHTARQQVLRVDKKSKDIISKETETKLINNINKYIDEVDGILISDYGLGTLSANIINFLNNKLVSTDIPVVLDSRYNLKYYRNVTIAAPNEEEAGRALDKPVISEESAKDDTIALAKLLDSKAGLITMGREGMALYTDERFIKIPIVGSEDSVDVTGAGDTVSSVLLLALASGATCEEAARLANAAASQVVMHRGTAVVTLEELKELVKLIKNEK